MSKQHFYANFDVSKWVDNTPIQKRYYVLVCLKRSTEHEKIYWKPDSKGYTNNLDEAGFYTSDELDDCAGKFGDWIIEPHWRELK